MMNKKLSLIMCVILTMFVFLSPIILALNPSPIIQNDFFNTSSTEASNWTVSENGSLWQKWSVKPAADSYRWNTSNDTNRLQNWYGNDTIVFNDTDGGSTISMLLANNSQNNRTHSLLWSFINSSNWRSNLVYVGPIFMNTTSGNGTAILYGNNSTFVFNYGYSGGKWGFRNTEDYSYGDHAGDVIVPTDGIDYYNETTWGEMNITTEGIFVKTIYNTYCGRIQSKVWGSDTTLMQEPTGWIIDDYFVNATTDNSTFFGLCVWNPLASHVNVSFDYINNWRLNYSLNASDTISWDTESYPRPHMEFPILNMSSVGYEWWSMIIPFFIEDTNITNDTASKRMRNLTNNMSMESRPFDVNQWADFDSPYAQNDTVYYYTSVLTNFTDFLLDNYASFPEYYPPPSAFANNYLALYVMQCEDGDGYDADLGYDYTAVFLDLDNNRQWDSNDRAVAVNTFFEVYSWTGTDMDVDTVLSITEGGPAMYNDSNVIGFSWLEQADSPRNLHRYNEHVHTLILIPLWTCVKSNGATLDNGDTFGLSIVNYNDRPEGICVWENWNETECTTYHNESDVDDIADKYWSGTTGFLDNFWDEVDGALGDCLSDAYNNCINLYWKNYSMYLDCFRSSAEICLDSCQTCGLNIDNNSIDMWGEGKIPGSPPINDTEGRFAVNVSIDLNITYLNETETGDHGDNTSINVTFTVCDEGDMNVTNLKLNLTWLNCSCSDWKFWYVNSNISIDNITFHNDSCYAIFNLSNMTGETCLDYWINIQITECVNNSVGDIWITAEINTTSGLSASANDSVRLIWGVETESVTITGGKDSVNPFEISETVLFFTGMCILISALLALIAVVVRGGRIF